jgi:hypothetical protein
MRCRSAALGAYPSAQMLALVLLGNRRCVQDGRAGCRLGRAHMQVLLHVVFVGGFGSSHVP